MGHSVEYGKARRAQQGWPETIPPDLRLRMLDVLSYRHVSPADVWDEVREWLDQHEIAVMPKAPDITGDKGLSNPAGLPWSA